MSRLEGILLLVRDVAKSVSFYGPHGLGLKVLHNSAAAVLLELNGNTGAKLRILQAQEGNEAPLSTGYTPMISFEVDNVQDKVMKLVAAGAYMDGPIKYANNCVSASVKTPDGHMVGLVQRTTAKVSDPPQ